MSGSRTGTPAPTKGRYSEQLLNVAPQMLRPVGGFNTTDAGMSRVKNTLALQKRLAGIEQRLMEKRTDAQGQQIGLEAEMGKDNLQVRRQSLEAREKISNAESEMGFMGNIATGLDIAGTAYDTARSAQESLDGAWFGKKIGKFADALGKIRPMQEKRYQAEKKTAARQERIAKLAEAGAEDQKKYLGRLNETLDRINGLIGQIAPSVAMSRPDEIADFVNATGELWATFIPGYNERPMR